jgi:hypothetical protein
VRSKDVERRVESKSVVRGARVGSKGIVGRECHCVVLSATPVLLDINLYNFNGDVFIIVGATITTHPHLNVIGGGLWQLLVEPWGFVEAAFALGPTPAPGQSDSWIYIT